MKKMLVTQNIIAEQLSGTCILHFIRPSIQSELKTRAVYKFDLRRQFELIASTWFQSAVPWHPWQIVMESGRLIHYTITPRAWVVLYLLNVVEHLPIIGEHYDMKFQIWEKICTVLWFFFSILGIVKIMGVYNLMHSTATPVQDAAAEVWALAAFKLRQALYL